MHAECCKLRRNRCTYNQRGGEATGGQSGPVFNNVTGEFVVAPRERLHRPGGPAVGWNEINVAARLQLAKNKGKAVLRGLQAL